jgi:uncharacterized protein (AIM24 family)
MAHEIDYKIFGDDMQAVEIELDPNEAVRAEIGAMLCMEDGIEMQTGTEGGIFSGLKRIISGENFFITSFLNTGTGKRNVTFAAPYPGKLFLSTSVKSAELFSVSAMAFFVQLKELI